MLRSHFAAFAPHCPVCLRDRATRPALGLQDGAQERDGDITAAILVCADPACRHEYPVIDGIPVILPELRRHLGERAIELLMRDDLDPAALSLIGDALGPDCWFDIVRQGISTYAWDAFGDLDPQEAPGEPRPGAARRCLAALLDLAQPWRLADAALVLDLGCGGGRTSLDLAAGCRGLVLGIDGNLGLLRIARRAARTGRGRYARRRLGLVYDDRVFHVESPGRGRVDYWACDAMALPFAHGRADAITALNLLDCVPDPRQLLAELAAHAAPGGAILLATPFDWSTRATPAAAWVGGHSQRAPGAGAAEPLLHAMVDATGDLAVTAQGECGWHTRLHDRASVQYRTHLLALRKS